MATKERIHELIDSLPDTPETEQRLDSVVKELEPNGVGAGAGDYDQPVDEDSGPTFQERLTKLAETIAGMDFPPREDAWR